MYYDAKKSLFYIDTAGTGGETGIRQAINAFGAEKTLNDSLNQQIDTTYIKGISIANNQLSYTTGDGVSHSVNGTLGAVTGVKGSVESSYRTGDVSISPANLGLESKTAASGGTDISLVTTGEKYTWNSMITISETEPTDPNTKIWVAPTTATTVQVPTVAESLALGISNATVGNGIKIAAVDSSGNPTSWETADFGYTLPTAAANALGGIKIGYTTSGKNYAVTVDSNGNAYVNVPWEDTHQDISGKANLNSPAFTGTPTAPTAANGTNNTQIATTAFVMNAFTANDAMVFKGILGTESGMIATLPTTHSQGWTYKVGIAGTYAGQVCEIGDTIYCVADGTTANDAHWVILQTNVDGTVIGPAASTADHIATFTGTTGKVIKDSGFTIATSVPANAVFTDTTYSAGTGLSLSGTTINHSNNVVAKAVASQAAKILTWNDTFTIYEETYDSQGHITGVINYNMTMPANPAVEVIRLI